ncbi:carbohydrate kinase family protein [Paracnuella aquatica]|uniref:carbohydrate kinase family protein n=1 Tax=Paracnuella aquatica TaxID=2268757 RepID=UPI000DEEAEC5|nr:carbohydrate kinase [Paracnuella aquatica]RPD44187.1 carbohydrate kinase [Paracnuella aquatica]
MNLSTQSPAVVCFGEILWDVLPHTSLPGGAPMNVAYHLKKLGVAPALISRIGADERGKGLLTLLEESGIPISLVQTDAVHETGWVQATQKAHNEMAYDIVQPVAWDFIQWQQDFSQVLADARYFVFGSLAARNQVSRSTLFQLLETAPQKVLDINLRPPHFDKARIESLLAYTDVLKMNEGELELVSGWYGHQESYEAMARSLQDRFAIATIVVTLGANGALVLQRGQLYRQPGISVQVADTIGSGDAFLAGFLAQQLSGAGIQESLSFACSLGALIATYTGACPPYDPSAIKKMGDGAPDQSFTSTTVYH